ncbi:MAG: hypothetical protein ABEJ31_03360 [Haloarculaceae archaeon]
MITLATSTADLLANVSSDPLGVVLLLCGVVLFAFTFLLGAYLSLGALVDLVTPDVS